MTPDEPPLTMTSHATCLGCGCLCDDITVEVFGGRVVGAERACPVGFDWYTAPHPGDGHPPATIGGRAVELEAAVERAAGILGRARSPLIWGLTRSSVEGVGAALALADRLGAAVDLAGSGRRAAHRAAFVRVGAVSATLGEVKDRAEVVLFWGNHPDATHPRHAERYSVHPSGRFLAGKRTILVVDVGSDVRVGHADLRVTIRPEDQDAAFSVLLALAHGVALDPARVERATGQPLRAWEDLIRPFRAARWSAIFFGPPAEALGPTGWDAALGLVRDLNADGRRCVGLKLGEPGNVAGAESVACWQAGAPGNLDFAGGFPRHLPLEVTLEDRLMSGEVDAVLAVGLDQTAHLGPEAARRLGSIPWIHLAPGATAPTRSPPGPTVAFNAGRLGIEAGGTVARVDGVMLPLRPPLVGRGPTDRDILAAIADRLG